ncbi:MAG: RND transporter, partial [Firmicutes bacterium]|nr:RND transporter [Bacillota bacterium]
ASGFILGRISSEGTIVGIGESLGRGTLISIALVMFTLPQILLIGERFIEKTSFSMQAPLKKKQGSGIFTVDGLVRGEIRGRVTGLVKATVEGDIDLTMVSGPSEAEDRTGTGEKEESDEK